MPDQICVVLVVIEHSSQTYPTAPLSGCFIYRDWVHVHVSFPPPLQSVSRTSGPTPQRKPIVFFLYFEKKIKTILSTGGIHQPKIQTKTEIEEQTI